MAKVFGVHTIELRPGVKVAEFEKFLRDKLPSKFVIPGWNVYIARGNRGEREGKYLLIYEIDSVEARDQYSPQPGEPSQEATQLMQAHKEILAFDEEFGKLASEGDYTDYVVIAESVGAVKGKE
jgi:hypothetical protein